MPMQAPVSHHLDLYAYWRTKRGARLMPARSDIDAADIPVLLPYLIFVDRAGDHFRYRLVGTAVARALGQEPTGEFVGYYLPDPDDVAEVQAIYERVFTTARPVFATGAFIFEAGAPVTLSLLALPLSADGINVDMVAATLVVRYSSYRAAKRDWLKGLPVKVCEMTDVGDAEDLKKLCLEWEQSCEPAA